MDIFNRLDRIAAQANGILRTSEAVAAGVSKSALAKYIAVNGFERVAHGVYLAPNAWKDGLYLLSLRCSQGIFSHETALFLHDLTDREPSQYTITVKTGYNPTKLTLDGVKVYTIKKELYPLGVTALPTPFGHQVAVYNMERTLCDIVRSRRSVDPQSYQTALKQYSRKREKDLTRLMAYAEAFHVENTLRQYLEVLL